MIDPGNSLDLSSNKAKIQNEGISFEMMRENKFGH